MSAVSDRIYALLGSRVPTAVHNAAWRWCVHCDAPRSRRHRHRLTDQERAAYATLVGAVRESEAMRALQHNIEEQVWGHGWAEPVIDASDPSAIRVDLSGKPMPPLPPQHEGRSS